MFLILAMISFCFFLMSFWFVLGILSDDQASNMKKLKYLTIISIVASVSFTLFVTYVKRV